MLRKGKLYLFLILFVGMAFVAILGKWVSCFLPSNLIQNNIRNSPNELLAWQSASSFSP